MAIIIMMILPMPAIVLDIGLAASFALAILIFTITLFIEKPLDFSSFPTVLLAALMLRLSLNISSTKLIIGQGHTGTDAAGNVIEGFAQFIMGGSVFLGLVVFCVLLIVNFMVITKGAARMAEVGARFALDGMPGKQLAIDSDMSAGAIDHDQARVRRETEQLETTFFGSLDGASKFVKGDAVAGLLITLLNLIAGLCMGVFVHDMPMAQAFETYSILTVGDGLVTQIPAVVISIASALLLARGGNKGATDLTLVTQLGSHPAALMTVSVLMMGFALVPGLPFIPFFLGGMCLGGLAYWMTQKADKSTTNQEKAEVEPIPTQTIGDILALDDIHLEFAPNLIELVIDPGTGLDARITSLRNHVASTFGIILPEIRLTDNHALVSGTYTIRVHGVEQVRDILELNRVLVLLPNKPVNNLPPGRDVKEPVYGAAARWVEENALEKVALAGLTVVTPAEILATHLLEAIKQNLSRLLTLKSLQKLLDEMVTLSDHNRAEANRKLLDEVIPDKLTVELLHRVLRLLLDEQVSIRNLPLIMEAIVECRQHNAKPEAICEHVRQRLGFQMVGELKREDGSIPLVQLAPEWEETFANYEIESEPGQCDVALPPDTFHVLADNLTETLSDLSEKGTFPALVTSGRRRRFLQSLLSAKGINNPVLSFEEIGRDARPALVGIIAA